jgi:hypothetical protein
MTTDNNPNRRVTVCNACLCASCWQGMFRCSCALLAGTTTKTVTELKALELESPHFWKKDR